MDAESRLELQKLDCNCNDCKFMVRDMEKFNKWREWRRLMQLEDFERKKAHAIKVSTTDQELNKALKMSFQFDSSGLLNYGSCTKLHKEVSFIPNNFQLDTQACFEHRKP
jgi:hypothetical protein